MRRTPTPFDAALAWSTLGIQWMEMMAASSQVIARRSRRLNTPAQLFTMGSEKVEAMVESSNAIARHIMAPPPSSALAACEAWARLLASGMAPFHTRATRNARRRRTRKGKR
jgi:hypothetical protein